MTETKRQIEVGIKGIRGKKPIEVKLAKGESLAFEVEVLDDKQVSVRQIEVPDTVSILPQAFKENCRWIYSNALWDLNHIAAFLGTVAGVGLKYVKNLDSALVEKMHEIRDVLKNKVEKKP